MLDRPAAASQALSSHALPSPAPGAADLLASLRPEASGAPASGIVETINYGRTRPGLIPLWVGEGDLPTPPVIAEAASASLRAGETFYTYQRGVPELREALGAYGSRIVGRALAPERYFATASGMHAVQLAMRLVAGPGDEVIVPTPAWPNFAAALGVAGARVVGLPMAVESGRWRLDIDRLAAAVTPRTRAIVVNSPSNPTGWTATIDELRAITDLARARGLWIVADEIYARFTHDGSARAPSFHDVAGDDERVLYVGSFSKNWAMTGWRAGWLEAPEALGDVIENLIQYSTSGVPVFVQRAAVAALTGGEGFALEQVARARAGRAVVQDRLAATGRASFAAPEGAFYLFFRVEGLGDARAASFRIVDEANVGLAPGTAFGAGGEGYLRLCFQRDAGQLAEAADRLARWIGAL